MSKPVEAQVHKTRIKFENKDDTATIPLLTSKILKLHIWVEARIKQPHTFCTMGKWILIKGKRKLIQA